jgi:hypothetical protein
MRALEMKHDVDPKLAIQEKVGPYIEGIEVLGPDLLLGIYVRPTQLKSGLHISQRTQSEDVYQGKVALVLKMGPLAFKEDDKHRFGGRTPKEGDWVAVRVGDTFQLSLGEHPCRMAEDVNIKAILTNPDAVI